MKLVWMAAMLAVSVPQHAFAQERSFDFFGFSPSTVAPENSKLSGKKCRVAQSGVSSCNIFAGAVLGRARVLDLTTTFNDARLFKVTGMVMPQFYPDLVEAFDAKYGAAAETSVEKWQNRVGGVFDNVVKTWRFDEGNLVLRQRGDHRDVPEFTFLALKNVPKAKTQAPPAVNF